MKDKEKQIEEIIAVMTTAADFWNIARPRGITKHRYVGEKIYEKFIPKIDKDSVVISKAKKEGAIWALVRLLEMYAIDTTTIKALEKIEDLTEEVYEKINEKCKELLK